MSAGLGVVVAAGLGWLAAWLMLGERASLKRLLPPKRGPAGRSREVLGGAAAAVGPVVAAWVVGGPRAAVMVVIAVLVVGTGLLQLRGRRRHRRAQRRRREVAGAASALAGELAIGKVPAAALADVARDFELLRPVAAAGELGGDVATALRAAAAQPGAEGLGAVGRAWGVSERTGAPMAASLAAVADALRAERELTATVDGELAAPRATGRLLAGLPLGGLALGFVLGGDPVAFLLGQPIGWGCLVGGVTLACVGLLWSERIADQAGRP